uniref:FYFY n=1 Tax=Mizuhopecten yessoensis TaxID=6573 RepID=A0A346GAX1_MIZYE|nr:FYFY [Mizuhopecten yessoensis]
MCSTTCWIAVLATFVACTRGTSITRYQHFPLPMCSEDTVCSEISELPSIKEENNYFSWMMCQCPGESVCPKSPGKQTIEVTGSKWYGMCRPKSNIRSCSPGEVGEEYYMGVREIPFGTFTRVHCLCPLLEYEEGQPEMEASNPKSIYQLICSGTGRLQAAMKRGRGGSRYGGGKNGRRFYFYRK